MDCSKHTADLIHINEPNLYNENLMPAIFNWLLGVYQRARLIVYVQVGDKLKAGKT